jgi:hypothetical protein
MDDSCADDGVRPPGCLDGNTRDQTPFAAAGRRKVIRHGTQYKKYPFMRRTGMHNENGGKA